MNGEGRPGKGGPSITITEPAPRVVADVLEQAEPLQLFPGPGHLARTDVTCAGCGRAPVLRRDADGRPMHLACEPKHSGVTDRPTSWNAGRAARRGTSSPVGMAVLELLRTAPNGMTDDELAVALAPEDRGVIAKRRGDLVRLGYVVDTGRTRLTRRNRDAVVWAVKR